jgi:hypothetical protein
MKSKLKKIRVFILLVAFFLTGGVGLMQDTISPAKSGPFGKCGAFVIDYGAEIDSFDCIYHIFRCECKRY